MIAFWELGQAFIARSFGIRCIEAGVVQYGHADAMTTSAGSCDLLCGRSACITYFLLSATLRYGYLQAPLDNSNMYAILVPFDVRSDNLPVPLVVLCSEFTWVLSHETCGSLIFRAERRRAVAIRLPIRLQCCTMSKITIKFTHSGRAGIGHALIACTISY
jgi:hypothetical protein